MIREGREIFPVRKGTDLLLSLYVARRDAVAASSDSAVIAAEARSNQEVAYLNGREETVTVAGIEPDAREVFEFIHWPAVAKRVRELSFSLHKELEAVFNFKGLNHYKKLISDVLQAISALRAQVREDYGEMPRDFLRDSALIYHHTGLPRAANFSEGIIKLYDDEASDLAAEQQRVREGRKRVGTERYAVKREDDAWAEDEAFFTALQTDIENGTITNKDQLKKVLAGIQVKTTEIIEWEEERRRLVGKEARAALQVRSEELV